MRTGTKTDGQYVWVRVSFSRSDVLYSIPNCYAKIWVPDGSEFPPGDRYLCFEDVVLPLSAEEPKRSTRPEGTNLVALRNMPRTFPGSDGTLYVNQFQIASLLPLDPKSELVQDLRRIARVVPVPPSEERKRNPEEHSRVVSLDSRES